jgi:hypothetical protein
VSILEDPRRIDLSRLFSGRRFRTEKRNECQTWRTCEQCERGYDCVRWDDGVVRDFRAVFDYSELPLPAEILERAWKEKVQRGDVQ